jgi:pre-mRNA-splicing factor CDC5/CEF1
MRILIKGGVWKNTEDEILKAAVMKYGKNQWARVASLLNRKSAKQCKARWYEWLDPSIKKIEWSREEEEKLLHLAKLMPNQWRTIAPIVGRTAGQCMEHYEKLLDMAQEEAESAEAGDDPRRLRPGEIDPAPETKPARPDPIDMDEDEKEMLAEARARLANTKGKKAKRKARERQLEESRQLSILQKRRELKAAGIESKLGGNKKRKYIDFSKEIPFQKVPPAGFYDTADEIRGGKKMHLDPAQHGLEMSKMEGRHEKEEEEREKAKDKRRLKTLFKANAAQAIVKISEQSDPISLRQRVPLSLPSPQVSDGELEDIVKAGQNALMPPPDGLPGSNRVTQALVGDYSAQFQASANPTPQRTPMQEDIVMQEARNLRKLREMTPMTGEDLPELEEGTGFGGIAPRSAKSATPNLLVASTPGHGGITPTPSRTPGTVTSSFNTVGGGASVAGGRSMQLRDQFGLNDPHSDAFSVSEVSMSSRAEKMRAREQRELLSRQLKGLPEPEYTYEVAIPSVEDDGDGDGGRSRPDGWKEDAADVEERLRILREEERAAAEARKSAVLKRKLPRPTTVAGALATSSYVSTDADSKEMAASCEAASALINSEMVALIRSDNYLHADAEVAKGASSSASAYAPLEEIGDDYMASAREMIQDEVDISTVSGDDFAAVWESVHKRVMYIPKSGDKPARYGAPEGKAETLAALAAQFAVLRGRIEKDSKRAGKLETKLTMLTKGYGQRAEKLEGSLLSQFEAYQTTCTDLRKLIIFLKMYMPAIYIL